MLKKKQLIKMRENNLKVRDKMLKDIMADDNIENSRNISETRTWFEKIDVLLSIIIDERTREDSEDLPYWWIGQFEMENGEGWLDFIQKQKNTEGHKPRRTMSWEEKKITAIKTKKEKK